MKVSQPSLKQRRYLGFKKAHVSDLIYKVLDREIANGDDWPDPAKIY